VVFATIMAIPVIAIVLARRSDERLSFAHIVFAAVMALIANVVLLRDVIATRLQSHGYAVPMPETVVRRFPAVSNMLRAEAPEMIRNRERLPLVHCLSSCTPVISRVFVAGFAPERRRSGGAGTLGSVAMRRLEPALYRQQSGS
jgi:hypothetical protein